MYGIFYYVMLCYVISYYIISFGRAARKDEPEEETRRSRTRAPLTSEGGMDTVGNPHRTQIYQFELFELKFINSSFSSLSSY